MSRIDTETGIESETNIKDKVKTDYENLENNNLKTTSNNTLLANLHFNYILLSGSRSPVILISGSGSVKNPVPEEIASMVKFDIIQSSLLANTSTTTIN